MEGTIPPRNTFPSAVLASPLTLVAATVLRAACNQNPWRGCGCTARMGVGQNLDPPLAQKHLLPPPPASKQHRAPQAMSTKTRSEKTTPCPFTFSTSVSKGRSQSRKLLRMASFEKNSRAPAKISWLVLHAI